MRTTCRYRIVRRAVMVIAVVVVLTGWYVSSYMSLNWCVGRQLVSLTTFDTLVETVFRPITEYRNSDWPGSQTLKAIDCLCYQRGRGESTTWEEEKVYAASEY